jgi:simple sugar transport system ATP-binding protein
VPRTGDIQHTLTLEIRNLTIHNHRGVTAVKGVNLNVGTGEIVGVAGVSGNGQTELVEVLAGQRQEVSGRVLVAGNPYQRTRADIRREQVFLLSEEPLRNSCVPSMTVSENLALRNFDEPKNTRWRWFIHRQSIAKQAQGLIERFSIKTQGPDAQIKTLSGGNVQRAVLARELSEEVSLLIAQNPCSGLDLNAVAEIRNKIVEVRNAGAAVLLISEDLDEILALSDRIVVMFEGQFVYETTRDEADVQTIGRYMASRE